MKWWQSLTAFLALAREVQEIKKTMVSRQELDDKLAALPQAIGAGITAAVTPLLQPIVARLQAIPNEDFSAEVGVIQTIPDVTAKAVGDAIAAVFAPVTTTAVTTTAAPTEPVTAPATTLKAEQADPAP